MTSVIRIVDVRMKSDFDFRLNPDFSSMTWYPTERDFTCGSISKMRCDLGKYSKADYPQSARSLDSVNFKCFWIKISSVVFRSF